MGGEARVRRHDLVSVLSDESDPFLTLIPQAAHTAWFSAGCPLVVRRGPRHADLPLGLPLPPAMGKARIALSLASSCVSARNTPSLREVSAHAPRGWLQTLATAGAVADANGVWVAAYGALLWQTLLGIAYLHAESDLDLLWRSSGPITPGLLSDIAGLAARAPMRIDGEIIVGEYGVQWWELAMAEPGDLVLVRTDERVVLRPANTMLVSCEA